MLYQGRTWYPSREEAEYTAPLAFAMAVLAFWWAVQTGHASLAVPRHPIPECAGRREHWLAVDARAMREWAMALLAISLGLRPPCTAEAARLPRCAEVQAVLRSNKTLPDNHMYVGQGHHSHRLPIGKWACPLTLGVNCSTDDWMNLYAEHIMSHLASDLPHLAGMTRGVRLPPDGTLRS